MRDLKLDSNGDIDTEGSRSRLTQDIGTTARQSLQIRLKTFYGEWKLDSTKGVPYLQAIIGQKTNTSHASNLIRLSVYNEQLVKNIKEFKTFLDSRTRELNISFTATAVDGTTFSDTIEINL